MPSDFLSISASLIKTYTYKFESCINYCHKCQQVVVYLLETGKHRTPQFWNADTLFASADRKMQSFMPDRKMQSFMQI